MQMTAIRSRPVYPGLAIAPFARRHIFALEGEGAGALLDLAGALTPEVLGRSQILYVARGSLGVGHHGALQGLGAAFWAAPTVQPLLGRLDVELARSHMGTRLYLAGTEGFIGQAMQVAAAHGIDPASVLTEHRGSRARRVQCVHCKGVTEGVTTSPFTCGHCGLNLYVRDHYSRRLGAFQGVNIDAEEPGAVPPPEELYL